MLDAFALACQDAFAPPQRRALLTSVLLSLVIFVAVWVGCTWLLGAERFFDIWWIDKALALLGSVAVLVLSWLLFPTMVTLVLGFFLDGIVARLERQHYPDLPPAPPVSLGAVLGSTVGLTLLTLVVNLVALPFYLWPGINLFIYYGVNGYLLARQFFELVALRRLDRATRRVVWRWYRGRLVVAGIVIAVLFSLPLVNLLAPMVAASFMLHLFEALRRRASPVTLGRWSWERDGYHD